MKFSTKLSNKARASPGSDARRMDPIDVSNKPGPPQRSKNLRIASWNVGTLTGKSMEIAEALNRRNVNICCLQETHWKGSSAKNLGNGYRLYYSGTVNKRNGVGIAVDSEHQERILKIQRMNDRIMSMTFVCPTLEEPWTLICAYAPQTGCAEEEKDEFYGQMDNLLRQTSREKVIIAGDLNGHVGTDGEGLSCHGGKGVGQPNEEGRRILDMAEAANMIILNTCFDKKEEHRYTYTSGNRKTQIDFILAKQELRSRVRDCKCILGEPAVTQHRLLVSDWHLKIKRKIRKTTEKKIKWRKLEDHNSAVEYRLRIFDSPVLERDSIDWEALSKVLSEAGTEALGTIKPGGRVTRETWWWDERLRDALKTKKQDYKAWHLNKTEQNREKYKTSKKNAKIAVAKAKANAYEELYQKLGSREGEKEIYRIARARDNAKKDGFEGRYVKDEKNVIITDAERVKERWAEYFEKLLNEARNHKRFKEEPIVHGPIKNISIKEVRQQLARMKKR